MRIIFSRHGNTFAPGETAIWVGAREDLPLVDSGVQQAKNLARVMQQTGLKNIKAVYCGPLKRTHDYANIILNELHSPLKPIIDPRLNEIDYGDWSGLSTEEIQKKGGNELSAWENFSKWPKAANWLGSSYHMSDEIKSFAEDIVKKYTPEDTILVVTSNGRLRYFLQLVPDAFEQHIQNKNFKVATGNLCLFVYDKQKWQIKFWNKKPESLL